MDEYIRKSDAIEQALAQIHRLDITVRERILNFDGKAQAKTNADRIRAMTDEELAKFISGKARGFGEEYEGYMSALDWLKEECG